MKTRFAAITVAMMLAITPACRSAKDNNPHSAIKNAPTMVEPLRDVMGAEDSALKVVKEPPKPDAETHQADVLKATPQPVKPVIVPKKLEGHGSDELLGPKEGLNYKGSR